MNEERISKLGARTEALVLNVSQKYKEMTERLGGMEEEGSLDIEFQKEWLEKIEQGTAFKVITGKLFRINESLKKLPRVSSRTIQTNRHLHTL